MIRSACLRLARQCQAHLRKLWQDDSDVSVKRVGGAFLGVGLVMGALVAGCGGTTTVVSQFKPSRVIVFGDALSDLGQVQGRRYSVNDGTTSNWTEQVAVQYGSTVTAVASGGLSYAVGNARILAKPDAAGNASTLTVNEQVSRFLTSGSFQENDLVLMTAGTADLIALYRATGNSAATTNAAVQAGRDYAELIKRVVGAGAKRVLVLGAYNIGLTPWGQSTADAAYLSAISKSFDERLLVEIVGMGANVLYLDGQNYFSGMFLAPGSFGLANSVTPACTSIDAGAGIGTGLGLVSSALCTTSTLAPVTSTVEITVTVSPFTTATATVSNPVSYNLLVFADGVYLTPAAQLTFGNYAYSRLASRW